MNSILQPIPISVRVAAPRIFDLRIPIMIPIHLPFYQRIHFIGCLELCIFHNWFYVPGTHRIIRCIFFFVPQCRFGGHFYLFLIVWRDQCFPDGFVWAGPQHFRITGNLRGYPYLFGSTTITMRDILIPATINPIEIQVSFILIIIFTGI